MTTEQKLDWIIQDLKTIKKILRNGVEPAFLQEEKYLSPEEIALKYPIAKETVRKWRLEGKLIDYQFIQNKVNRRGYRYSEKELKKLFECKP